MTSITIPDSVTSIGDFVFGHCRSLTSIEIPDSVISIGEYVFESCTNLTSLVIGDGVTTIGNCAFEFCSNLASVYYKGTVEDWSKLIIGTSNKCLTNATRYYYSETQPTEEGNYWHYVDGKVVVW